GDLAHRRGRIRNERWRHPPRRRGQRRAGGGYDRQGSYFPPPSRWPVAGHDRPRPRLKGAHVAFGSSSTEAAGSAARPTSASPQKPTSSKSIAICRIGPTTEVGILTRSARRRAAVSMGVW